MRHPWQKALARLSSAGAFENHRAGFSSWHGRRASLAGGNRRFVLSGSRVMVAFIAVGGKLSRSGASVGGAIATRIARESPPVVTAFRDLKLPAT